MTPSIIVWLSGFACGLFVAFAIIDKLERIELRRRLRRHDGN